MASKLFYHDVDLNKVGQLQNARVQNLSAAEIATLAATLSSANTGLVVYNTTSKSLVTWNGSGFDAYQIEVTGDIKFAGAINATNSATITPVPGAQYVVDTAGTLDTQGGTISYSPSANVEVGDSVIFTTATTAFVVERNLEQATEEALGTIRLASQADVTAGSEAQEAVTPATLHGYVNPITSDLQSQITSNDGDIADLQSRATAVEGRATDLETFTGEGTALTTSATTLAGAVNELVSSAATIASDLAAEVTRAQGAEGQLASDLSSETNARQAADTTLQSNIDAEATARQAADTTLQNNIDTEATARANADTTLQANIDTEAATRAADDATLQSNINAEATTRANADTTLQGNIDAETTARQAADTTLQGNIDAEYTARTNADITLQSNIDAEATTRADADSALDGRATALEGRATALEARDEVFTYFASVDLTANTPATVSHGLGLADQDSFTINTMYNGAQVSLAVTSVNGNSLTIESAVSLTGVKVAVIGF